MEPELVARIEVEPNSVEPDGHLDVHVQCVDDPYEQRPANAPYGWVRVEHREHGHSHLLERRVTRVEWPVGDNEFTVQVELREQIPPGALQVTAACHDVCCGYVQAPPVAMTDYQEGPSIYLAEPLQFSIGADPVPPQRSGTLLVDGACPVDAGVGNARVWLFTIETDGVYDRPLGDHAVRQVTEVPADAYQPTDPVELAFHTAVPIPSDAPPEMWVYVTCIAPRGSAIPGVEEAVGGAPIPFSIS